MLELDSSSPPSIALNNPQWQLVASSKKLLAAKNLAKTHIRTVLRRIQTCTPLGN